MCSEQTVDMRLAAIIEKYGIPGRDLFSMPDSDLTFPDGAHYRNEISGIGSLRQAEDCIDEMRQRQIPVHRIIYGDPRKNTFEELRQLAKITGENGIEVIINPGPISVHDIGSHAHTEFGKWGGWRPRGSDNLRHIVSSILRCREAGLKGFLIFCEGTLSLLSQMRANGDLPSDIIFKVSYTAGIANPAHAKLLQQLGANSFNPVTDLTLAMLASMRKACTITMDVVIFAWESLSNISRISEVADIVRICSPVYLKQELNDDSRTKVKYCEIIREFVDRSQPELRLSPQGPQDLHIAEF